MVRGRTQDRRRRRRLTDARQASAGVTAPERPKIVPWRQRVVALLEAARAWGRRHYPAVIATEMAERYGDIPDGQDRADLERSLDDILCTPGSAGPGMRSIVAAFADEAEDMTEEERVQARRWERERSRGVFVVQRCRKDVLELWDPLEGAPLSLHLLEKMSPVRAGLIQRGTVVTTNYLPWMARLIAVGRLEFFAPEEALPLFRTEVVNSGARWHELPPAAPRSGT